MSEAEKKGLGELQVDEFLEPGDLVSVGRQAAGRALRRVRAEVEELFGENKWEEVIALFHPVEEKLPDLVEQGMEVGIRADVAFALGKVGRYDDAIQELEVCVGKEPGKFRYHSSLAYTAYDSLYAALNREILLSGKVRAERIALAHKHFKEAQELRPGGVTNFYREGMLYRRIEGKTAEALPCFDRAVANWDALEEGERKIRHQERKNFVKAVYQKASCLLELGRGREALQAIQRCLEEDEKSEHLSLLYKYFALGKVQYHLNRFKEAKDALLFALRCRSQGPRDFVWELLARTYLAMDEPKKALEAIGKIPEKKRRPYVRWTEADAFCAMGDWWRAKAVLQACQERDARSKHRALIRLARIAYLNKEFTSACRHAEAADEFFRERWGNRLYDGLFWQALAWYRLGRLEKAEKLAQELQEERPGYPKLDLLLERLGHGKEESHGAA